MCFEFSRRAIVGPPVRRWVTLETHYLRPCARFVLQTFRLTYSGFTRDRTRRLGASVSNVCLVHYVNVGDSVRPAVFVCLIVCVCYVS